MNEFQTVLSRVAENAVPLKFILVGLFSFIVGWKSHGASHGK
jgi:hypothetical protein